MVPLANGFSSKLQEIIADDLKQDTGKVQNKWESESLLLGNTVHEKHMHVQHRKNIHVSFWSCMRHGCRGSHRRLSAEDVFSKASAHQSPLSFCLQDQLQTNVISWHVVFSARILQTQKHIWPEHWLGWAFKFSSWELKGHYGVRCVLHCSSNLE